MIQTTRVRELKSATISNSAKAISHNDFSWTAGVIASADRAILTARTGGVMFRYDGSNPTATVGHLLPENGTVEISGRGNIANLIFIREASTDATLSITIESDE